MLPRPPPARHLFGRFALAFAACVVSVGCSGCGVASSAGAAATTGSPGATTGTTGDGGSAPNVDRGPDAIPIDGDPNGLFWDAASNTLYIADSDNNRVLTWTDGGGVALLGDLPGGEQASAGLGQLVRTADGTVAVTIFGFGTTGGIGLLAPDGSSSLVPNLDPEKRRIGIGLAPDGTLYDTYFKNITGSEQLGAVARLSLAGTEVDVVTSLQKPIGVIVAGDKLVMSDQASAAVLTSPLSSPSDLTVLAQIDEPDLLCEGPDGSFFTGGPSGDVRQITADGKFTTFAGGFLEIRGVAYDATNKRVFASEHDPSGLASTLRILPVD